MAMKMIKTEDASVDQIRKFCIVSGIEGVESLGKAELIDALNLAGYPTQAIYVDDGTAPPLQFPQDSHKPSEFDTENERWVVINIAPDSDADDRQSAVFVGIQNDEVNDYIHAKRGVDICIRERFYVNLLMCVERRKVQRENEDGGATKMSDAEVQMVSRYPTTFIRYAGLVSDGPPEGLPEGVEVYRMQNE